jgi:hypothetical protein
MSLIIVRRKKKNHVKDMATIKLYSSRSYFTFSYKAKEIMNLKTGDGVMFGFNFKDKKAFISKDNDEDSFKVNKVPNRNLLRFGSKDLKEYFMNCFQFEEEKVFTFEIILTSSNKYELQYRP